MVLCAALVAGCIVTPTVGALAGSPVQPFVVAQATLGTEGISAEATKDLFAAVYKNDLAAVKSSVLAGADIYSRNAWGMAALDIAIDSGYFDVAFYLLSVRNNRQAPDARKATSTTPVPVPQPVLQPEPQPVVTAAPAPTVETTQLPQQTTQPAQVVVVQPTVASEPAPPPAAPEPVVVQPAPEPVVVQPPPEPVVVEPVEAAPSEPAVGAGAEPAGEDPVSSFFGDIADLFGGADEEPESEPQPEPVEVAAAPEPEPEPVEAPEPEPMPAAEAPEEDAVSEFFSSLFGSDESAPPPAQPEPVVEPEPEPVVTSVEPEPVAAPEPEPIVAAPEPEPEPVAASVEPEPVAAPEPEPVAVPEPEPVVASVEPEPVAAPEPEPEPMPAAEAPEEDAVSEFFSSLFGGDESAPPPAVAETDIVVAETGPAAVDEEVAPALPSPETIAAVVVTHPEVPEPTLELRFGPRLGLGRAFPEGAGDTKCVTKQRGSVNVCISEGDWPVEIEPVFRISSVIYQGSKVIARYVDGRATRYFANFPTGAYDRVVGHFRGVYGPPQLLWDRKARLSGGMLVDNPVTVWRKTYPATGTIVYLEVRRHDDVRRDFADGRLGAVRLYIDGTDSVFAGMSTGKFLLLR